MISIIFELNGEMFSEKVEDNTTLFTLLKDYAKVNSIKTACNQGDCGLCTVLLNDVPTKSCIVLASEADGGKVTTVEGLKDDPIAIVLRNSFAEHGAFQCGYCTPAFLLAAVALLRTKKNITQDDVLEAINGILCRCTGYQQIIDGILAASIKI